jgi:hypothetical protein
MEISDNMARRALDQKSGLYVPKYIYFIAGIILRTPKPYESLVYCYMHQGPSSFQNSWGTYPSIEPPLSSPGRISGAVTFT